MANNLNSFPGFFQFGSQSGGPRSNLTQLTSPKIAPVITNVSPASGNQIGATASIQFDLTVPDGQGLSNVIIWVEYSGLLSTEVVYNGTGYAFNFTGSVVGITDGNRYTFQRTGGYPSSPTIKIQATSFNGGVN